MFHVLYTHYPENLIRSLHESINYLDIIMNHHLMQIYFLKVMVTEAFLSKMSLSTSSRSTSLTAGVKFQDLTYIKSCIWKICI